MQQREVYNVDLRLCRFFIVSLLSLDNAGSKSVFRFDFLNAIELDVNVHDCFIYRKKILISSRLTL